MACVGRQSRESKQSKGRHSGQLWGPLDEANSSEAMSQIPGLWGHLPFRDTARVSFSQAAVSMIRWNGQAAFLVMSVSEEDTLPCKWETPLGQGRSLGSCPGAQGPETAGWMDFCSCKLGSPRRF